MDRVFRLAADLTFAIYPLLLESCYLNILFLLFEWLLTIGSFQVLGQTLGKSHLIIFHHKQLNRVPGSTNLDA